MFRLMYRVAGGRLLAVLAALAMAIGGAWAFRTLPVDAFPDTSPSLVQVFTPTEASGIGAVGAAGIAFMRGHLRNLTEWRDALVEATRTTVSAPSAPTCA